MKAGIAVQRPVIAVAAGCLVNAQGEVLIAQRPAGKVAAGLWEFPGGKIEPGETAREALVRELQEELAVQVETARPLIRIRHDYSDRTVVLDTWRVTSWAGAPHGREDQALAWVRPGDLHGHSLLAADLPIVSALRLPVDYVFTAPHQDEGQVAAALDCLPAQALLRLRLPALDDASYEALARRLAPRCRERGLQLILDRDPAMVLSVGAAGWHAPAQVLIALAARPAAAPLLCLASCHDAAELARARSLGFDGAVLGPVLATASHPQQAALGWQVFGALVAEAGLPVYAIGGVGPELMARAHREYAQGTAGISAYWRSPLPGSSPESGAASSAGIA